jgi:branched-chain amino acid transport system ATP-binding protein
MAVAGTPKLILLDEPAAGLSPAERVGLVQLLQQIPRQISIIIIEHDMEVALRVAERITVMHQGAIVVEGTPQEIQENQTVHDIYMGKHVH